MSQILPFIVSGIATGAIYGLAGTGLVLTYKTSGIFNFGHGAVATVAAYAFYWLHVDRGMDWKPAVVLSVVVLGPLMGLLLERIARRLANQQTAYKVVGTVGFIVLAQGLAVLKYGTDPIQVPGYLPKAADTFELFGVIIGWDLVIITAIAVVAVALLYALFRYTRVGLAMRAVVDDPDLLDVQGTDPVRVRRASWLAGSTFAALSGVLVLPLVGLETITLTFLVVQAFGAAAIGAFASIPLTFVGGVLIGVIADVSKRYVLDLSWSWLPGLPASIPFLVLFLVLLVLPRRKLLPPVAIEQRPRSPYKGPAPLRILVGAVVVALFALVPAVQGQHLRYYTSALITVILVLSLGLLVKTSGQVSLCHASFMGVGACAFSQFRLQHGMPWLLALLLAALVTIPMGAIVAIPAIRLSGLFLALATFGFGIMVERLIFPISILFGTSATGREMPRPSFASTDTGFYFLCLAFVVVVALVVVAVNEARLGRLLRGIGESPLAVSTLGLNSNLTRLIVFCISAFLAAVGGILYGVSVNIASPGDAKYGSFFSLLLLTLLIIAPFREPWYIVPAIFAGVVPAYITAESAPDWLNALFGITAVIVALDGGPHVMPQRWRDALTKRFTWRRTRVVSGSPPPPVHELDTVRQRAGLQVENLTVRFGGLVAVDGLSLLAPTGQITGLIGPNGAGKTTTFNSCSGLNRPASGRVLLHGDNVTHEPAASRARKGLGRTFQRMELCDGLTVAENVALGRESGLAGSRVLLQMVAPRAERLRTESSAAAAMELCGIAHLANRQAGELSTGQRRLVELARCIAGPFDVLLLDEPSAGLDRSETEAFGDILLSVVEQRGCGILLVEHDVALVSRVSSYIYVLDFGRVIFEGDPQAVAASPIVRAAYLGDEGSGELLEQAVVGAGEAR